MADIFKKVTNGLDKRIKIVSLKGKELIETKKLKKEIENTQELINSKFQALGRKVFEMINRDELNINELKERCKEIILLFRKIVELEEKIKKIEFEAIKINYGEDIIICSTCGSPNKSDAKFCMNCGSPIIAEVEVKKKRCPICNTLIEEGAKFCIRCGAKVE